MEPMEVLEKRDDVVMMEQHSLDVVEYIWIMCH